MFGERAHNIALRQDADDGMIGARRLTTAPIRRSARSFAAAVRSAVGWNRYDAIALTDQNAFDEHGSLLVPAAAARPQLLSPIRPKTGSVKKRDSAVQKDFWPRRKGRPIYGPELRGKMSAFRGGFENGSRNISLRCLSLNQLGQPVSFAFTCCKFTLDVTASDPVLRLAVRHRQSLRNLKWPIALARRPSRERG